MRSALASMLLTLRTSLRARTTLQLEILALRHQLQVLERSSRQRVRLTRADRLLWVWLSRVWDGWREAVIIIKPEPDAALQLLAAWKARAKRTAAQELIFSTGSGKPISPNNVLRRWVWPACQAAQLERATWLTFRRTYSSWAHDKGVPAKVVAQIMGHTKVDTTMNVYTQVLDGAARSAADRIGAELFRIVQIPGGTTTPIH